MTFVRLRKEKVFIVARCVGKLFQATLIDGGILTDLFCISVFLLVLRNSCSHYQLM